MALRQPSTKQQIVDLVITDQATINPFAWEPYQGSLENVTPLGKKLIRVAAMPVFHNSSSANSVWHIIDFRFMFANAPNQQLLIVKSNGKVYKVQGGMEQEIFPGPTSFNVFGSKPSAVIIADRLHVADGSQYVIWDGYRWVAAGLAAPASPTTSFVAGSLTGQFTVAVTFVDIVNGVRIHESPRSATVVLNPSAQNIVVNAPASPPGRLVSGVNSNWSVYMSEVASSTVLRRVATNGINTASVTISAVPAGTNSVAPIRNDAPPTTKVLGQWKNRVAARNEQAQSNMWFSSFGEVKALNNGAPEESWAGFGASTISDLTNEWTLPDRGEKVVNETWHDDFLFIMSDRNGYIVEGDGSLLDNRAIRDFYPKRIFPFGAANAFSVVSTPWGIVILTADRRLWLWSGSSGRGQLGGEGLINIGIPIQKRLNAISPSDLAATALTYWENNGRTWLLLPLSDRVMIFDFTVRTQQDRHGIWFSLGSQSALPQITAIGGYFPGTPILLAGGSDGKTYLLDTVSQPAIAGVSATANQSYLSGGSVLASPTSIMRTASISPAPGVWAWANYVEYFQIGTGDTNATGIRTSNPTFNVYYDGLDPTAPANAVLQGTPFVLPLTKERRVWLASAAGASAIGGVGRRMQLEFRWTITDSVAVAGGSNLVNNELWMLALSVSPRKELYL